MKQPYPQGYGDGTERGELPSQSIAGRMRFRQGLLKVVGQRHLHATRQDRSGDEEWLIRGIGAGLQARVAFRESATVKRIEDIDAEPQRLLIHERNGVSRIEIDDRVWIENLRVIVVPEPLSGVLGAYAAIKPTGRVLKTELAEQVRLAPDLIPGEVEVITVPSCPSGPGWVKSVYSCAW